MSMRLHGFLQKLVRDFPKDLFFQDYPLGGKNTWGVGGDASLAFFPERPEQVVSLIRRLAVFGALPWTVLGGGSNILISDKGFPGCIVFTEKLNKISILPDTSHEEGEIAVYVDSGVPLGRLLRFCLEHFLGGLEFTVGIPGSIGGALIGNAGAQGEAIGNLVRYVDVLLPEGTIQRIRNRDILWEYRFSSLSQRPCVILGCALGLLRRPCSVVEQNLSFFAEKRKGQPVLRKTAGSVFKNPREGYAGELLELSGCKGMQIGGARVSTQHANFIENYNKASSQNILDLIFRCRKMVMEHTGTILYPEVRFVGFESSEITFY